MLYGFLLGVLLVSGGVLVAISILQDLQVDPPDPPAVMLVGESEVNVTLQEMLQGDVITRLGAYQNRLGNIGGNGTYQGVRVSDLVDLVGGMAESDNVTVIALDGYNQTFPYSKVYPNQSYYDLQGDMVIAFGFEGDLVPSYSEGFRLMFLPEDGLYSNADANATTDPDPPGAGPQCVTNVIRVEVGRAISSMQSHERDNSQSMLSEQAFSWFACRTAPYENHMSIRSRIE